MKQKITVIARINGREERLPAHLVKMTPDSKRWDLLFERDDFPSLDYDGIYIRADSGIAEEALKSGVYDGRPHRLDMSSLYSAKK